MRAGLDLVFTAAQRASERMRRIAVIVKYKIGMPIAAQPAGDPILLFCESSADGSLSTGAVVPGRRSRDVFVLQALAEFCVSLPYVLAQRVAAKSLVA